MNLNELEWSFVILGIRWYLVSVSGRMPNGSTSVKKLPVDKIDSLWARCRFFLYFHRRPHSGGSRSHSTPYGQSGRLRHPPHSRRSQDDIIFLDLYRSHSMRWSARDRNVSYRVSFFRPRLHQIWQKYSRIIICINWEISSLSTWTMSSRAPVCAPLSAPATPPGLYLRVWYLFSLKHSKIPKY